MADYVTTKIKEALAASQDDKGEAEKILVGWAVRDQQLLLGLTKPHLKAITRARIAHAVKPTRKNKGDDKFSKDAVDAMIAAEPKSDRRAANVPPPKSSMRQASVMHQLAAAFKKRT